MCSRSFYSCSSWRAPTPRSSRHRFSFFTTYLPLAGAGDSVTSPSMSTGSSTSLSTPRYPPVQNITFDRHIEHSFQHDKDFGISRRRQKTNRYLCLNNKKNTILSSEAVPRSRKIESCDLFSTIAKWAFSTAVLHPHEASCFASASHGGVFTGLLFLFSLRYHNLVFCVCALLSSLSRKRRLSYFNDAKVLRVTGP